MTQVRCAIYTRKSGEEGLEQDFNSLHAQREACVAYVLSQASEGWTAVPESYDDGGLSGGSLERPALQRLLADIEAGQVDIVVVYKVDRLTRSLLDFAKLVETFDRASVSFVSVTQSFNTTTSMGRLTLNMLLSFAQFEREVTAERIRDKIAASKARGMWMGGIPPLGYQPDGRSLAIVEEHAALVRMIYDRYGTLGNVRLLADEMTGEGILTPVRTTGTGRTFGGCPFSRGQLYAILRNPIYVGDIAHRGTIHSGNQPPIIEREVWDAVQAQLSARIQGTRTAREASAAMLSGRLVDERGVPLIAVHARKGQRRYRYYVSRDRHHQSGERDTPAIRIPAPEIEQAVGKEIARLFSAPTDLLARCGIEILPALFSTVLTKCRDLAVQASGRDRGLIRALVQSVTIHPGRIDIVVAGSGITEALGIGDLSGATNVTRTAAVRLRRSGRALRLVDDSGAASSADSPDETLARLILRARGWWREIEQTGITVTQLATKEDVTASYLTRVLRFAFLAPDVVTAVLDRSLRAGVDAAKLFAADAIDQDWSEQRRRLLPATDI